MENAAIHLHLQQHDDPTTSTHIGKQQQYENNNMKIKQSLQKSFILQVGDLDECIHSWCAAASF